MQFSRKGKCLKCLYSLSLIFKMFSLISKRQCVGQPDKPVVQVCSGIGHFLERLGVGSQSADLQEEQWLPREPQWGRPARDAGGTEGALRPSLSQRGEMMLLCWKESSDFSKSRACTQDLPWQQTQHPRWSPLSARCGEGLPGLKVYLHSKSTTSA